MIKSQCDSRMHCLCVCPVYPSVMYRTAAMQGRHRLKYIRKSTCSESRQIVAIQYIRKDRTLWRKSNIALDIFSFGYKYKMTYKMTTIQIRKFPLQKNFRFRYMFFEG